MSAVVWVDVSLCCVCVACVGSHTAPSVGVLVLQFVPSVGQHMAQLRIISCGGCPATGAYHIHRCGVHRTCVWECVYVCVRVCYAPLVAQPFKPDRSGFAVGSNKLLVGWDLHNVGVMSALGVFEIFCWLA